MSDLEDDFEHYGVMFGMPRPQREYRFARPRMWRFDFAWPDEFVAVELEGGTWVNGRHNRPAGFEGDCEKYNRAAELGWRVLRFTRGMLEREPVQCMEQVMRLLANEAAKTPLQVV